MNETSLNSEIKELNELSLRVNKSQFNPQEHKDRTRSTIALHFIYWFFIIILSTFIFTLIYNAYILHICNELSCNNSEQIINIKDMLLAVMWYIWSPLWFVIGYYFKWEEK